ncbi:MAG TPA: helix-turn-helix transcriptional regulator [Gemmatimonadaceae bacterium]|jgi:DNA-binding PadR family transcriptional regulator
MIKANSSNVLEVDTGSLYPALHRLERATLIDAKWDRSDNGQRVRVYRLTAAGRTQLVAERTKWERMTQAIAGILNPPIAEGKS